jgi:hypothetical protein
MSTHTEKFLLGACTFLKNCQSSTVADQIIESKAYILWAIVILLKKPIILLT